MFLKHVSVRNIFACLIVSDTAFSNGTAKTVTVIKNTGTDTIKQAKIFLTDTCFKNKIGGGNADLMIQSDGSIDNVKVVKGYTN